MDGPREAWPALPDLSTSHGKQQFGILLDICRTVLRTLLLHEKDEHILLTVSRSGYIVYWTHVKSLLSDGG